MPVLVGRIERLEVNCLIWLGRVTRADALGFPATIDPASPEFGRRWISYFDASADLSDLDAACLMELQELLRPVVLGLAAKGELRMTLVSNSTFNDPLLAAWRAMTVTDPRYASNPVLVHDIPSAARAMGLSPAEGERARIWIEARIDAATRGAKTG